MQHFKEVQIRIEKEFWPSPYIGFNFFFSRASFIPIFHQGIFYIHNCEDTIANSTFNSHLTSKHVFEAYCSIVTKCINLGFVFDFGLQIFVHWGTFHILEEYLPYVIKIEPSFPFSLAIAPHAKFDATIFQFNCINNPNKTVRCLMKLHNPKPYHCCHH